VGWQRQSNGPSIQGHLEDALSELFQEEKLVARAVGRTDAGVHSRGQVVAFQTGRERKPDVVKRGLNALLPAQIVVLDAVVAPSDFDPRSWSMSKWYQYRILNRRERCPFRAEWSWHISLPLQVAEMQQAAKYLVGVHDFASFQASGCAAAHATRLVTSLEVNADGDEVVIDCRGTAFVRHQVRIMVGTLVEVGLGQRNAASLPATLEACDRSSAGRTAPALGLWLMEVSMGEGPRERSVHD